MGPGDQATRHAGGVKVQGERRKSKGENQVPQWMKRLDRAVCAIVMIAAAGGAWAAPAPQSASAAGGAQLSAQAHSLYERTRDSTAQIRVLLGASDSHAATGTGFVVGSTSTTRPSAKA